MSPAAILIEVGRGVGVTTIVVTLVKGPPVQVIVVVPTLKAEIKADLLSPRPGRPGPPRGVETHLGEKELLEVTVATTGLLDTQLNFVEKSTL